MFLGSDFMRRFTKNRLALIGLVLIAIVLIAGLLAPWITRYNPTALTLRDRLLPPSLRHLCGTDALGRDVFTRILYGARISLSIALLGIGIGATIGTMLGLLAGYYEGVLDNLIMRMVDISLAFPPILLAILLITILGPGLRSIVAAIGAFAVPVYARLIRGTVLSLKRLDYVDAARAMGCANSSIMLRHILPNAVPPLIVQSSLMVASAVLIASSLSFVGLGAQPPTPEWGAMLASGRVYLRVAPWVSVFPGVVIMITVLGLNLLGDGLRDTLDPRLRL